MASSFIIKPIVDAIVSVFAEFGIKIYVTSGFRTREKQKQLYESGQELPVAMPGRSQHEYGVAVDMVVSPSTETQTLVDVWRNLGFYWDSSDYVHYAVFSPTDWFYVLEAMGYQQPVEQPPVFKSSYVQALEKPQTQIGFNLSSLGFPQADPFILPYQGMGYDVEKSYNLYQQTPKGSFFQPIKEPSGYPEPQTVQQQLQAWGQTHQAASPIITQPEASIEYVTPVSSPQVQQASQPAPVITQRQQGVLLERIQEKLVRSYDTQS